MVMASLAIGDTAPAIILAVLLLLAIVYLALHIWAMYSLTIEMTEDAVHYRIGFRTVHIDWDKVTAIRVEPWKRQITFWRGSKLERVHHFGLSPAARGLITDSLQAQRQARNIRVR